MGGLLQAGHLPKCVPYGGRSKRASPGGSYGTLPAPSGGESSFSRLVSRWGFAVGSSTPMPPATGSVAAGELVAQRRPYVEHVAPDSVARDKPGGAEDAQVLGDAPGRDVEVVPQLACGAGRTQRS